MLPFLRTAALVALAAGLWGCRTTPEPAIPVSEPHALCVGETPQRPCLDPAEVEGWLTDAELEIVARADPPAGRQDAHVLTLVAHLDRGDVVFRAKWRAASSAHQLNSPRKELAAHAVQKLVLAPEDWVVPPVASHCFPVAHYRARIDPAAMPSFRGGSCVLGFLSYWLEDARDLDAAEDEEMLEKETPLDPVTARRSPTFRRSVADVNLLAHLISHGDSHPAQFVVTGSRANPAVRLVDNTIAFSHYRNPSIEGGEWDWSRLQVPAVRAQTIERLRTLAADDVEGLLVIEQHALREGRLVRETPGAAPPDSPGGVKWVGNRLQIGLTRGELAILRARMRSVLDRVDTGSLETF